MPPSRRHFFSHFLRRVGRRFLVRSAKFSNQCEAIQHSAEKFSVPFTSIEGKNNVFSKHSPPWCVPKPGLRPGVTVPCRAARLKAWMSVRYITRPAFKPALGTKKKELGTKMLAHNLTHLGKRSKMPYFTLWSRKKQAVKYVARRTFFSAVAQ